MTTQPRRHDEDAEQQNLYCWAAISKWKGKPISTRMFSIPNGGKRNAREAARLKRQGVRSGVSDCFLHIPVQPYAGLFIELKVGRNKPTKNQLAFMADARAEGYATAVAYGWLDARTIILDYLEGHHVEQSP